MAFLEIRSVHKRFGRLEVLRGIDIAVNEHQVVCLIGPSGCGKSTLLRCINGLEADPGRRDPARGRPRLGSGRRCQSPAPRGRHRLPELQSVSAYEGDRECHAGADQGAGLQPQRSARARAMALLTRIGLEAKAQRISRPPVGRPAAARRDRPGARHGAEAAAARRDHLGARSRARLGSSEHRARPGRARA